MAAQGRKNVHGKAGVRFKAGYTASKNKSMLRNVVTDLVMNGQVQVTSGVVNKDGKDALTKLFGEIAPRMANRQGGYTKSFKLGARRGDDAEVVLVRWSDK